MKLVEQAILHFQQGNSDKVYEAEICEVGKNEFVVNFRYGRRGTKLQEGTKTVFPVPYQEAKKVFDKLVSSKTSKGYQSAGAAPAASPTLPTQSSDNREELDEHILKYLQQAASGSYPSTRWKLSRVIWRAGELRLKEAEKSLQSLSFNSDELFNYSLIWALGRCGSSGAVGQIRALTSGTRSPQLNRIAKEAIYKIGDESDRASIEREAVEVLPSSIKEAIEKQDMASLSQRLNEILFELGASNTDFLPNLYVLAGGSSLVHTALMEVLQRIPLKPNFFKQLRYIFKASEFRDDTLVYGLLAARFEREEAFYNTPEWGTVWMDGDYLNPSEESKKPDSKLAYSSKTRAYLRSRVARSLKKMGHSADQQYTAYARDVLLVFTDEDDKGPSRFTQWHYDWESRQSSNTTTHFPSFSEYPVLFHLLYGNSARFEFRNKARKWQYKLGHQPGQPEPAEREEAFPALWDASPEALVDLLKGSACRIVQAFAAKAFKANPHRTVHTDIDLIVKLLGKPYETANSLGLELAQAYYDPEKPDISLIEALLNSSHEPANQLAIEWIEAQKTVFLANEDLLVVLVLCPNTIVAEWAKTNLTPINWEPGIADKVLAKVLDRLAGQEFQDDQDSYLSKLSDTLLIVFAEQVRTVPLAAVQRLLDHSRPLVQAMGAKILVRHEAPTAEMPDALLTMLMTSDHPEVRAAGVALFGKLPEDKLMAKREMVINFCISKYQEIRRESRTIVRKLIAAHGEFGQELVELLLPIMWRKEPHEGLHDDLLPLMSEELLPYLSNTPAQAVWKLVECDYLPGNELGCILLKQSHLLDNEPMGRTVSLGNHELLALRQLCWDYFSGNIPRVKYEAEQALKLFDAKWDDSRDFAFDFFSEHFGEADWTPELLISICDSTNESVQDMGKKLLTQFFKEEHGVQYMLKLSQHPNTSLQLFVSNYLERFAKGQADRIFQLEYYFTAVLSQVNKGRVAKERAYDFLGKEAAASEEVAKWLLTLLTRVSLTVAIRDKAYCITLMHSIQRQYPHLESPLTIKEIDTI
ncbi:MAG: WGR domain-containing protein [Bacteroidota bacterium]